MSNTVLFGIGAFVFFMTVYGVVMAGSILLGRDRAPDERVVGPAVPDLPVAPLPTVLP